MTMKFEDFKTNVQQWASERGIYEHSTATAQSLKACSEAGELCDAVIKGDRAALIDAIGDVSVCLVNVCAMTGVRFDGMQSTSDNESVTTTSAAARLCVSLGYLACDVEFDIAGEQCVHDCFDCLLRVCELASVDFESCCESAWNEIKDRKGHMVHGGAFVKDQ